MSILTSLSTKAFSVIALALLLPSTSVMVWTEYQMLTASRGLDPTHRYALWGLLSMAVGWTAFFVLGPTSAPPRYMRLLDIALLVATGGQLLPVIKAFSTQPTLLIWLMFIWPALTTWFLYAVLQRRMPKHAPTT